MWGKDSVAKKSPERRCLSRVAFFVSMDAAATVIMPLTSPAGETVACPVTWPNAPFTGASPHMLLLRSPIVDLAPSRVQSPANVAPASSSCSAGAVSCPDGAIPSSITLVRLSKIIRLVRTVAEPGDRLGKRQCGALRIGEERRVAQAGQDRGV